ncbi:MAG TPA: hypothetical protein VMT35_07120 [Ignavibacteriaceae bacterium]|nr:hypothetical protein [Ignavibacteriaceae bacterium]
MQQILVAQQDYYTKIVTDTIPVNFSNIYYISHLSIIPFTETIILRDSLLSSKDYKFSYEKGTFTLSDSLPYSIYDTLFVTYQTFRIPLQKEYKRRSLVRKFDEKLGDTIKIVRSDQSIFGPESIFGRNIEKSGTLVRGFTIGTNKDFSLNSGLRLQLSGNLSDDIEVVAALTDENTPIQPEGNTERLEELDKVFIQIKHPNAAGTFGDYELQRRMGEFGNINRKLQGLLGEFNLPASMTGFGSQTGYVSIAGSRGKFNTNLFNGIDGVQGPYRLNGINDERDIIVIAGTERVYIDGVEMKRGENNDYTIEYSTAEVTFTPQRLITSASRITIDFEYTDRKYSRNFFGAGVESNFLNDKLGVKVQYLREGDNEDAPIDISLSDDDKKILGNAGDNRNLAVKSGVLLAEPDSLGVRKGAYEKIDTLINSVQYSYYRYNPGNVDAVYNVNFSFVGDGKGDYSRESLGVYTFRGIGQGGYLPVVFLPLPELKQVGNIALDIKPFEDVQLNLEYGGSLWDKNRFSSLDDNDNYGYATNIFFKLNPKEIKFGDVNLGKAGLSYKERFIQKKFTSPDRLNEIEFDRNYNIFSSEEEEDEQLREIGASLIPVKELNLNSTIGFLKRGDNFKSTRYNNYLLLSDKESYSLDYNFDYVESKNLSLTSKWARQKGIGYYKFWKLKPGLEFFAEDRKDKPLGGDSLLTGSLRYNEINPFLDLVELEGFDFSAKYSFREDFFPLKGILFKESNSYAQFYELKYNGIKEVNSTFNFTYRKKNYTKEFSETGLLNNETILVRSQTNFNLWEPVNGDLFYEVSTQRSARSERVFLKVEKGQGNYIYIGDLNNDGIPEENEFEPTLYDGDYIQLILPTDELFPVIDLKTSTRWKIYFGKIFKGNSLVSALLSPLSTETSWRVEENTREEDYKKIYFLNFSAFQNPEKTISGSNFIQQDLFLFENSRELSFRFRFAQTKSLDQFSGGIEKGFNRERSMRIRFKMIQELSNQTDIINMTDNVDAPLSSNRKRLITNNNINTDFSYNPLRNIEVGFGIKVGRSTDDFPANPTVIDLNGQTLRFILSLAGSGRLRIEFERNELTSNTTENFLPFELTGGNLIGRNYFWRLNFDYRLASYLQSTVSYDGRLQGGGKAIHTARAEVRAYF